MRRDPLAYLTAELDSLRAQGLYRSLRVLEDAFEQNEWNRRAELFLDRA